MEIFVFFEKSEPMQTSKTKSHRNFVRTPREKQNNQENKSGTQKPEPKASKMKKKADDIAYAVRDKEVWINPETGEQKEMLRIDKTVYKNCNFHKVWLFDLIAAIDELGSGKIKVLSYILDNFSNANNLFVGTVRYIAEETKASSKTVVAALDILCRLDFMRKIQSGVYQINPEKLIKGTASKQQSLLITYRQLDVTSQEAEALKKQLDLPFE